MKINGYPELTSLTDEDLILGWDAETGTTRKIKVSTIKTYCAGSVAQNTFTYSSNGDANGIFYWLGTYGTGSGWLNPYTAGLVGITGSSYYDGSASNSDVSQLVNRVDGNGFASQNIANSWLKIDLKQRKLKPSYYSIRARQFNANLIKNWKFQGSNDDSNWTDLDSKTNQSVVASQWFSLSVTSSTFYRLFRILQMGVSSSSDNILTLGEIELYGTLQGGF
ncbi:hypothetical protein I8748_05545 [Nostoc sp. CENA67]|uniref:F5/8 type C domain-containing protein n=1 Tax=Amazonocrinis nigriterrae CENA67 TaxID=2794033 RepID=A0A8J7HQQ0_9NOST|nr:hypothetical protein [Amazonocrinis nigriterrae]MBH8561647.1 hypothetical protein [Amazonocrinis nigriterrae CENA67]